jgi:septum formation protein
VTLILASASATRRTMLADAGVAFTARPADLDEAAVMANMTGRAPQDVAAELARQKARHVSATSPGLPVLGADSVLAFEHGLIGKAPDLEAARALLLRLRGRAHQLVSAAALVKDGQLLWQGAETVTLSMRPFSPAFLDAYLAAEGAAILSSVGCYRFEGLGAQLFERVDGDYFAVLGLPLLAVLAALRQEGILSA